MTATTRAQIRLAKLIQTRWHKRWAREGLVGDEYSIPLSTLRARLDVLDAQIWSNLRKALPALRDAKMHQRLQTVFLRRFRVGDLRDEERLSHFQCAAFSAPNVAQQCAKHRTKRLGKRLSALQV